MPRALRRVALVAVPVLVLLAVAWLAVSALQARRELTAARGELTAVREALTSGEAGAAAGRLADVRTRAHRAYSRTHDPVWWTAAHVPVLGRPLATVRGLTAAVRGLSDTGLPALAQVSGQLDLAALHPAPDTLDVERLTRVAVPLRTAADSLQVQRAAVSGLAPSWLGVVADARTQLLDQLGPLAQESGRAASAAQLLPPMLGSGGARRYLVAFQNPAEARGTGGLLGAYAVVSADRGRLRIERLGANTQLPPLPDEVPGLDPAFVERYAGEGATALWVNANVTPDFAEAAAAWRAMWRAGTGADLDGVVALDPPALAAVLRATGPVDAPGIGTVSADQVVPLVLQRQYDLSADPASRKDVMVGVGQAVVDALLAGRADPRGLLTSLQQTARDGHVLVESSRADEQAQLRAARLTGTVDGTSGPFAQAVVVNAAGGKLDAYLDSSLAYRVTQCSARGRTAVVTVALHNDAPPAGLPAYVVTRADQPEVPVVPGQNRTDLRVLTTKGARVTSASLDGAPLLAPAGELPDVLPADSADAVLTATTQAGRPSYGLTLELAPGTTRTLQLTLEEPPSRAAPLLARQDLARPTSVSSDVRACSPS